MFRLYQGLDLRWYVRGPMDVLLFVGTHDEAVKYIEQRKAPN
jgi:hypothetical protein